MPLKLFYRKYGEGKPVFILHGLFGQCDNWQTQAKMIAEHGYAVYTIDQRNHGLSPHSNEWNYKAMSDDVYELAQEINAEKIILLGHSMGGKTAMHFAIDHPEKIEKLIVVDIAPKYYPPHHQRIIEGLTAVDFNVVKTRKEVEVILSNYINDNGSRQFLLKNIYWKDDNTLAWRFNLEVIAKNIEVIGQENVLSNLQINSSSNYQTLFIRGEKSNYILDSDFPGIQTIFKNAELETIAGAGHWVHADKPKEFVDKVLGFIKS